MIARVLMVTGPPCGGKTTAVNTILDLVFTLAGSMPSVRIVSTGEVVKRLAATDPSARHILAHGCMYPNEAVLKSELFELWQQYETLTNAPPIAVVFDGMPRFAHQVAWPHEFARYCWRTMREVEAVLDVKLLLVDPAQDHTRLEDQAVKRGALSTLPHRAALWYGRQHHEVVTESIQRGIDVLPLNRPIAMETDRLRTLAAWLLGRTV